jgi:sugar-specific transcriptional regulator TrmB/CBS domain-containing protein
MFLAKSGVQSTSFAAKRLKMERVQAYRTFRKLQEKGFIEATIERPTRFTIIPFATLLDSFIESRKSEIETLNQEKNSLLTSWREISAPESEYTVAKFSLITGKKKIHQKMASMVKEAEKSIAVLTTGQGLVQQDLAGVFDSVNHQLRIITEVVPENLNVIERMDRRFSAGSRDIECRHMNLNSKLFPRFLIKDDEEAILYAMSVEEQTMLRLDDEGLWINDKMFISILKGFFAQMWQTAIDAPQRIDEIKTGIPAGETIVIKDPEEALAKFNQVLNSAQEDVLAITSSQGINNIAENDIFAKNLKKGVKCRFMAPLDLDNLEAAQKLSSKYEIKHVPINFLTMMLVDGKQLFMFKSPPVNDWTSEALFYMGDTYYTNDPKSIEKVSEMLNDAWKRGMEVSQITAQPGMRLPTVEVENAETVPSLITAMLKNNVNSILITENHKPIGVITDREVLREVGENKKNPAETLTKDIKYTPLITLDAGESVSNALKTMREKGATRIAVVKNGQLVGMLTEELAETPQKKIAPKPRTLKK